MAKRYSGNLQISVVYEDRGDYRVSVSRGGRSLWHGRVRPAPAGFGPGVAYDSPKAYDEAASSALAFADDEEKGIADDADYKEDMTGYLIRRAPRSGGKAHSTRKGSFRSRGSYSLTGRPSFGVHHFDTLAAAKTAAREAARMPLRWKTETVNRNPGGDAENVTTYYSDGDYIIVLSPLAQLDHGARK